MDTIVTIVASVIVGIISGFVGYCYGVIVSTQAKTIATKYTNEKTCKNIMLFLQSKYHAALQLKAIVSAFTIYIKNGEHCYPITQNDISVDDEEDVIIDNKHYEESGSK